MANKQTHLSKYRKNKKLAGSSLICKTENNDWRTVIIYYAALHIIDSTYADTFHPSNHILRKKFLIEVPRYKLIVDIYNNLEMLSRKARYDLLNMKPKEVKDALICLGKIEKNLNVS